jgi:hypothetical protein
MVPMVESIHRQGFTCLRGGRKKKKGGFKKPGSGSVLLVAARLM